MHCQAQRPLLPGDSGERSFKTMSYRVLAVTMMLIAFSVGRAGAAAAEGETLAGACTACHGPQGQSTGAVPSLAGLDKPMFIARMQAFRDGAGTIMNRIAPAYDDAQIAALADYFAATDSAAEEHRRAP